MTDINVQELAEKAIAELKNSPEKLKQFAANNEVLKNFLGEDGKLSKDDFDKVIAEVKKNDIVKNLLGEDGKLGLDDLANVANAAKTVGEDLLNKAKDLFNK